MIDSLPLIISLLAFYMSVKKFKTERLCYIYKAIFDELLLNEFPIAFNNYINEQTEENEHNFTNKIAELTEKAMFFQFYNMSLFHDLKELIIRIDENSINFNQSAESRYISEISKDLRLLYNMIYTVRLIDIIKYDVINFKDRFSVPK